ncbi:MAG: hypothetical protein ED556_07610 [Winogradskyella sp.]|uniref:hypothetical protein n=1 Tax=Winogradskyella sp. TaxID=1883156 RepID=UPI000F417C95|nr:hypothetical protein [Winogradskyella sp.]RNC87277.1 MAG: hypothetical protein ED556_07610 [Winogradskyella sp.]
MKKYPKLVWSLLLDVIGYVSFIFPPFDFIWAPLSGYLMTKLYKGKPGRIAGIIAFIEEALPFTDVIPTFTIMWLYTYTIKSKNKA